MKNENLGEQPGDCGGLILLLDDQLVRSGRSPIEVWEGQLKTEVIQFPHDLRQAVQKYVDTIIGLTRMGALQPNEYTGTIVIENEGFPMDWRSCSESVARVHDRMVEEAGKGTDENAQRVAVALSESFNEVINQAGFLHEGVMNRTIGYLFHKIGRFPQEPK